MQKPYLNGNIVDVEKYMIYYSDPFKHKPEYNNDGFAKDQILWDIIKTNTITKVIQKYNKQILFDLKQNNQNLYFSRIEGKNLYGEYHHFILELDEKIDEILNNIKTKMSTLEDDNKLALLNKKIEDLTNQIQTTETEIRVVTKENVEQRKEISNLKETMYQYNKVLEKQKTLELKSNNQMKEIENLKIEMKKEATLFIQTRIKEIEEGDSSSIATNQEYNVYLNIRGFNDLEKKLKEIITLNKNLTIENGKLKIQLDKLKIKQKSLHDDIKLKAKELIEEMDNILKTKNEKGKTMVDCYMYVLMKKRKNRSNREKSKAHLENCTVCKKTPNMGKFFSYQVTPLLIEILKTKGFEDYILFDEKNCCKIISFKLLKVLSFLNKEFKSKSIIWYRNFLVKKYSPINQSKISNLINKNDKEKINERFYWTYLSEAVCKNPIDFDLFMNEKNKTYNYYKQYTELDHELNTKTRLYNLTTEEYHNLKETNLSNVKNEINYYLTGEKIIIGKHIKNDDWNYKKAMKRLVNPSFLKKMKKAITTLIKDGNLITKEKHYDVIKQIKKSMTTSDSLDIIKSKMDEIFMNLPQNTDEIQRTYLESIIQKYEEKKYNIDSDSSEESDDSSDYY